MIRVIPEEVTLNRKFLTKKYLINTLKKTIYLVFSQIAN